MTTKYRESKDVPTDTLCSRLDELSNAITKGEKGMFEFYMRIPAELDHDADLVLAEAARRLRAVSVPVVNSEWISVEDRLPNYSERDFPEEEYDSLAERNRNRYLVKVEKNPDHYLEGGIYIDVLGFDHLSKFYGYDQTGEGTKNWRERIVAWLPTPPLEEKG